MHVRHTVASVLVVGLLIQTGALAQSLSGSAAENGEVVKVPRREAMHRLFDSLIQAGPSRRVRFEIVGGKILEGSLVESGSDDVTVAVGSARRVVRLEDIVGLRPSPIDTSGMSNGNAFGIGAAIGAGVMGVVILTATIR
jgi:hypothetical protein